MKLGIATSKGLPELTPDDRLLIPEFAKRDILAEPVIWSKSDLNWASYDAVMIRSCWDYWNHREAFLAWASSLEAEGIPLFNPKKVLEWNTKKTYLRKFNQNGIKIPTTEWVTPNQTRGFREILEQYDWNEVVIKPIISAGADRTYRIPRTRVNEGEALLKDVLSQSKTTGGALIQPFIPEILSQGEVSMIFFNRKFSHSVRKEPQAGDFRVQPQHGGRHSPWKAPSTLIRFGEKVLEQVSERILYARVDLVETSEGPHLMELELTEPYLYLGDHPEAASRLVSALMSYSDTTR